MFIDTFSALCNKKGVSMNRACIEIGISRTATAKWKNGSVPNGQTLAKIAEYFDVTVGYLLGSETNTAPAATSKGDVLDEIDVAFYGEYKELSEDDKETVRSMVRVMRERRAKMQEK